MGKLDGLRAAKPPQCLLSRERKWPFAVSWNTNLQAVIPTPQLLPREQGVQKTSQRVASPQQGAAWRMVAEAKREA